MTDISDRAWAREQLESDNLRLNITLDGGKYRVIQAADGGFYALRYDEVWPAYGRTQIFDNLTHALAREIERLRDGMAEIADFARKHMPNEEATASAIDDLLAHKE